ISPGVRGLPASFALYDFQLQAAADSLGRHDSISIAGLAQLYAQSGSSVDGGALARSLLAGIRGAAAKPGAPASLLGMIVRDLGLRHRPAIDLAKGVTATTSLDPVQALLIAADSAAHARGGGRVLTVATRAAGAPCQGPTQPGTAPAPVGP